MTQQVPYDVVEERPGFELRRYRSHHLAETLVSGSFEGAVNRAFRRLAAYLTGRNSGGERIEMTQPVGQERAKVHERYAVSFALPQEYEQEPPPLPSDKSVRIRHVPEHLAAAVRFSGPWTHRSYHRQAERLLRAIAEAGYVADGPLRFDRYDPLWTPWLLRRNEVVVPVTEQEAA